MNPTFQRWRGVSVTVTIAGLLTGFAAWIFEPAPVAGGGKKPKSEVKVTATATKPDSAGKQALTVTLDINTPWYAYANPVDNETFDEAKTTLKIAAKNKLEDVKIEYPVGKLKEEQLIGKYRVYEGKIEIKATLQRAKGDAGPLELTVKFMTCNPKGVCLPPETVKLTVP